MANRKKTPRAVKSKAAPSLALWLCGWLAAGAQLILIILALKIAGATIFFETAADWNALRASLAVIVALILGGTVAGHVAFLHQKATDLERAGYVLTRYRRWGDFAARCLDGLFP